MASCEAEVLKVVRMLARAEPSSTEVHLLFRGLACTNGSPIAALQCIFASAGLLRSALPSPGGVWAEGLLGQHSTLVLVGNPPMPAGQTLSVSEVVSNSSQGGETEGF